MKNIYFLTQKREGSSYLMGDILSKYCGGVCISSTERDEILQIKDSYIILVKKFIGFPDGVSNNPDLIRCSKSNNNKIIYIVNDSLSVYVNQFKHSIEKYKELYDLVLFPSIHTCNIFSNDINADVLYHIWDPRLKPNTATKFNSCYFGVKRRDKVCMIDGIAHINSAGKPGQSRFYRDLLNYNCHYSVRDRSHISHTHGTNTKLSTAAATGSNIICSKDTAFIDLIDNYDYYVDSIDEASEMLLRIKSECGSKKWFNNLDKLKRVKDVTSPHNIGRQLLHLLSKL